MSSLRTHDCVEMPVVAPYSHPIAYLGLVFAVWRQRAALRKLDDLALRDMGLTRGEAEAEASRSVWDVPANWRR